MLIENIGVVYHYYEFINAVDKYLDDDMSAVRTGKSLSIRIHVPIIDYDNDFDMYEHEMKIILDSVMRLYELHKRVDLGI